MQSIQQMRLAQPNLRRACDAALLADTSEYPNEGAALDAMLRDMARTPGTPPFSFLRKFAESFVPSHRRFVDGNGFD